MNKSKLALLIFLSTLFYSELELFAQSEFGGFENYSDQSELFHTRLKTLYQDSKGYVWIGSSDGLMRHDGLFFDIFGRSNGDSVVLSDNAINCIEQNLFAYTFWVGTSIGGINKVDIVKNSYEQFYIKPDASNSSGIVEITSLCHFTKDCLLVGTNSQGLYYFHPSTNVFIKLNDAYKSKFEFPDIITNITKQQNFIWVTTTDGLMQFNYQGEYLQSYFFTGSSFETQPVKESLPIIHLIESDNDNIVFTSGNTLYNFNWQKGLVKKIYQASEGIELNNIAMDSKGGYWIGSENNGLYYVNSNNEVENHYTTQSGEDAIVSNQINDLQLCQNSTILFVATSKGLSKYDYYKSKFKHFNLSELSNGEINETYTLIKDSKGSYWLKSNGQLYRKKKSNELFEKVDFNIGSIPYRIIEDDKSNLWICTDKGLVTYNLNKDEFKITRFKIPSYDDQRINFITCLTPIVKNEIYLTSRSGLIKLNVLTNSYELLPIKNCDSTSLNYRFTSIDYSMDKNLLWISNRRGELWKYDLKSGVYSCIRVKDLTDNPQKPNIILDIKVDSNDNIWLATYGNGVLIYDPQSNTISRELAIDMLDSYVYGIVPDDNGNFWISSNFGISRVNTQTRETNNFKSIDGTYCNEFNDLACYHAPDGNILFGGYGGFIEFNPNDLPINEYKADLFIDSYLVEDNLVSHGDYLYDDVVYLSDSSIVIDGNKSTIEFYISILNYSNSNENKIKWKLEGFDKDWNEGYSYQVITYNNLNKGSYTLRVKGYNNDGIESAGVAELELKVKAEFYQTLVFRILLGLIGATIILLIFKIRLAWYDKQEKILLKKVEEKTKALTYANEELRSTKEEILNQKTELEIHRNYLEDIVKLRTADLENAKIKAEESDRLKTSFLANLSHEIRTPMNAIIGFSSLLQSEDFEQEQKKHFLNVISQSSETLLVLINDIIDISRIETGNIQLIGHETHIPTLVKETIDELVFEEKSKSVRFMQSYELTTADSSIFIDRYRLKQIVSNLLRNAFKFTREGYVKLSVKSVQAKELEAKGFRLKKMDKEDFHPIMFIIEDTGIGIEKEDLKLIFEPFQKAQNYTKFYNGMGLGLSIVSNLLNLFGGDIKVESEIEKGTTFTFYIDVASLFKYNNDSVKNNINV